MYDYETSCVHTNAYDSWFGTLVADLKDSEHMKGEWGGFISGKVKLSITAKSDNYSNKDAGFMILNLGGLDFSQSSWTDKERPFFRIDTLGYDEDALPEGELFRKYPVFDAICFDKFDGVYGESPAEKTVSVSVYKASSGKQFEIKDGYFLPTEVGNYKIRYFAKDESGNQAEAVFEIPVRDVSAMTLRWLTDLPETCNVGEKVLLPEYEIFGARGEYNAVMRVIELSAQEECSINYGGFVPQRDGIYCVSVSVEDFLGRTAKFTYYIKAEATQLPVLISAPSIPKIMLVGKEISLPDFEAYDYYSLPNTKLEAEKKYIIRGADGKLIKTVKPGEKFTPDASFGEKVTIEYEAKSFLNSQAVTGTQEVNIVDSSSHISFPEYFAQKNITKWEGNYSGETSIAFFFTGNDAEVAFGQSVLFAGMDFSFRVPKEVNGYDTIYLTVTDSKIANRQVLFTIKKSGSGDYSEFYINGVKQNNIFGNFEDTLLEDFQLRINNRNEIIDARSNLLGKVETYLTGETFEGFNDNLCYLSFTFGNVMKESAFQIIKIGTQYMDPDVTEDYIGPDLQLTENFPYEQNKGEIFLPGAVATDVLYGKTQVKVDIYDNETNELVFTSTVGSEGIRLTLNNPGKYQVSYYSEDDRGNITPADYMLSVYDNEPFSVTLTGSVPTNAKLNQKVVLPSFVVDERILDYEAIVYVICPRGGNIDVTESLSFMATQSGMYKVYYYVIYEVNNSYSYNLSEYVIDVK